MTLRALLTGDLERLSVPPGAAEPVLLLPGSFNPLHQGHLGLWAVASRRAGRAGAFELSVTNVEKAALDEGEVRRRVQQFHDVAPLWLTRAPTFLDKARLFGGTTFVVGADTAARVVLPRFYGDSLEKMRSALNEIRQRGGRFLVAGRVDGTGFVGLDQLAIPGEFADLFAGIPEAEFREDVSSTQLRTTASG